MKTIATVLIYLAAGASLVAQGLINFANTPASPVFVQEHIPQGPYSIMSGPAGTYYFGLFFGIPNGGINYTFTGIYATNTGVDGLFTGGTVAVPGWAAGTSQTYFVAGWAASMGHDFDPVWFLGSDYFGASSIGGGLAGNGTSIPTLDIFNGGPGTIQGGFRLSNNLVPEPSAITIAAIGLAVLLRMRVKLPSKTRPT